MLHAIYYIDQQMFCYMYYNMVCEIPSYHGHNSLHEIPLSFYLTCKYAMLSTLYFMDHD